MIDRIEELLSEMSEDDEEQEREDVLALPAAEEAVPAPAPRDEGEAGETETERADANRELWKDGPVWTVKSGPPELDEALRTAMAGWTVQAGEAARPVQDGELIWAELERSARGGTAELTPEGAARSGTEQAGLEGLYRQTVRGLRPAAPALPPEQAGRTARAQEPGSAASLAVDELDRAVRRDSRRYDGGMSIY